jgi:hypothetical protein
LDNYKSLQEQIILDNFRKHFPDFPGGRLIKSESPDFILKTSPKQSIGIELTALPSPVYTINKETVQSFFSDIKLSVSKKQEKLKSYKKKRADSYWLIIYAGSIIIESINFNNQLDRLTVCSGFDRIFLFGMFEGRVWEFNDLTGNLTGDL